MASIYWPEPRSYGNYYISIYIHDGVDLLARTRVILELLYKCVYIYVMASMYWPEPRSYGNYYISVYIRDGVTSMPDFSNYEITMPIAICCSWVTRWTPVNLVSVGSFSLLLRPVINCACFYQPNFTDTRTRTAFLQATILKRTQTLDIIRNVVIPISTWMLHIFDDNTDLLRNRRHHEIASKSATPARSKYNISERFHLSW